ncbi:MAG: MFS transporter [Caldilineaceae bacterium]|nr:MFS transporter [Caldilineaceae bacterium]
MVTANSTERTTPGVAEQIATRVAFFIAGFAIAAWAPLIPYAKERLAVDEGMLGLLLLCLGIGSIIAMPITGTLAARFGCRRVIWSATFVICVALVCLALASTVPSLAIALLVFGAGVGTVDVTVNIQAVIVEKAARRAMMSGFHGLFSVGGIIGAGGVSGLLWAGASPLMAVIGVASLILVLLFAFGRHLLPYGSERDAPLFVWPRGVVLFIGFLSLLCFLAEGAILDWSAVFLTTVRDVPPSYAGWGYTIFSIAMAICRLTGDRVVQALGGFRILLFGGLCAAAGLAVAVLAPSWLVALAGFGMVGLGVSNIVPVLFSAAGRQTAMPPNLAIAAITFLGYTGVLLGPALIGLVAAAANLSIALLGVAALLVFVAASARIATR